MKTISVNLTIILCLILFGVSISQGPVVILNGCNDRNCTSCLNSKCTQCFKIPLILDGFCNTGVTESTTCKFFKWQVTKSVCEECLIAGQVPNVLGDCASVVGPITDCLTYGIDNKICLTCGNSKYPKDGVTNTCVVLPGGTIPVVNCEQHIIDAGASNAIKCRKCLKGYYLN